MPLHWPGSANVAASVSLYREQERALRFRPIFRPRLTAGLGSPVPGVWGPVGDRVSLSRSTSAFRQVHHGAGDPAAARRFARLSSLVVDRLSSSVRHGNSQSRHPGPLRFFVRSPPVAPRPFCDVSGAPLPAISIDVWGPCISREQRQGPAGDCSPTVSRPHWQSNSSHAGKRYALGRNRESGVAVANACIVNRQQIAYKNLITGYTFSKPVTGWKPVTSFPLNKPTW